MMKNVAAYKEMRDRAARVHFQTRNTTEIVQIETKRTINHFSNWSYAYTTNRCATQKSQRTAFYASPFSFVQNQMNVSIWNLCKA